MNYNLYNGGADSARVNQYVAKLNAAYDLRDKACRDVRQTAQIAYNDVGRLTQQLIFLGQHELSTAKAREAYRQQFDIGQRSLLDLLDTENELYQARRALTNAEHDLRLAKFRVLSASGTLLGALGTSPAGGKRATRNKRPRGRRWPDAVQHRVAGDRDPRQAGTSQDGVDASRCNCASASPTCR